jgi:hypothetical protein
MANDYTPVTLPFLNRGLVLFIDKERLAEGQYQTLQNVTSLQEGSIQSRNGFRRITLASPGSYIHSLGRCSTGSNPTTNYRYVGEGQDIYRCTSVVTPTLTKVVSAGLGTFGKKWTSISYRKYSSGLPYQYFATYDTMLKDPLTDRPEEILGYLQPWGLDAPVRPATATRVGTGGTPKEYRYVYTLRNPRTHHEGNPCVESEAYVSADFASGDSVTVDCWGLAPAPQTDISDEGYYTDQTFGAGSIAVYRQARPGGNLADAYYRFVGYTEVNAGTVSTSGTSVTLLGGKQFSTDWSGINKEIVVGGVWYRIATVLDGTHLTLTSSAGTQTEVVYITGSTFTDTMPDDSIAVARLVEFDNDPPSTADSQIPLYADITGFNSGGGAPGMNDISVEIQMGLPTGATNILATLRTGTFVTVGVGDAEEQVVVQAIKNVSIVSGTFDFTCYLQKTHAIGEPVTTAAICNTPCDIAAVVANSIIVAGDRTNKNIAYRSKPGRPEAFPVLNAIEVGTPSDYIVAVTEYQGQALFLNRECLYVVAFWGDQAQVPVRTPANRGLWGKKAWCKADNEIWYLSYDGIYSWSGGVCQKRSQAINPLFTNESVNGMYPISLDETEPGSGIDQGVSDLDRIELEYYQNQIFVCYRDTAGDDRVIVYHTLYDRWTPYTPGAVTMLMEEDIGNLLVARATTSTGTVDTNGTRVDRITGDYFDVYWATGSGITINGVDYTIAYVGGPTALTLTTSAGVQTGVSYSAGTLSHLYYENSPVDTNNYTTDGWEVTQSDGTGISYDIWTPFYSLGAPNTNKQWGDVEIQITAPDDGASNSITVRTYYDFSDTPDPTDTFTLPGVTGRRRVVLPLQSGKAKEAFAVAFRFTSTTKKPHVYHSITFHVLPLGDVQRGRSSDWDDLGHPYDKRLSQVTIEFDTDGRSVTCNLDTMSGIDGATYGAGVEAFTLTSPVSTYPTTGPLRVKRTYPIKDGVIAKLVRLRPDVPTGLTDIFKLINYRFDFIPYPPDIVKFTEWDDMGWPCEKIPRVLTLDVDTGGVNAVVEVQADDIVHQTFKDVLSTSNDRHRILTLNSDIIGKRFRLENTPGTGGKFQLFKHQFADVIIEPCAVVHWDSYEQVHGYNGWKFIKQIWVEYICPVGITVYIYRDDKYLVYSKSLPAHDHRDKERFYLPLINSTTGTLNKAKVYRYVIDSCDQCTPFKIYKDGTRVEFMPLAGDQRMAYQQAPLWEPMPIPAML